MGGFTETGEVLIMTVIRYWQTLENRGVTRGNAATTGTAGQPRRGYQLTAEGLPSTHKPPTATSSRWRMPNRNR